MTSYFIFLIEKTSTYIFHYFYFDVLKTNILSTRLSKSPKKQTCFEFMTSYLQYKSCLILNLYKHNLDILLKYIDIFSLPNIII